MLRPKQWIQDALECAFASIQIEEQTEECKGMEAKIKRFDLLRNNQRLLNDQN